MYQYQNPVNDFYMNQRPQYQQLNLPFPPPQPQLVTRYVSNVEEAKASMINPLSVNLYVDTASGKIYMKKMNNNGISEFYEYTISETADKYDPLSEINTRLSNIENFLGGINDKSLSGDKSAESSQTAVTKPYESNAETESSGFPKNAGNGWRKK